MTPGTWDTSSGNVNWVLAVAPTLDGALLNAYATMGVNFPVADGASFVVFASDYLERRVRARPEADLTATFDDGSTATDGSHGALARIRFHRRFPSVHQNSIRIDAR